MKKWVAGLAFLGTAACGITGPDEVRLHLSGFVREHDGAAVSGAKIELYPPSLFIGSSSNIATSSSGSLGRYEISGSVKSPCIGNGFGYVVIATLDNRQTDAQSVECVSADQSVDLTFPAPTP